MSGKLRILALLLILNIFLMEATVIIGLGMIRKNALENEECWCWITVAVWQPDENGGHLQKVENPKTECVCEDLRDYFKLVGL